MATKRKGGGRKKAYYERQKSITIKHKTAAKAKAAKELSYWIGLGKKKNGRPVLGVEARRVRTASRLTNRRASQSARRQARYEENKRGYHTQSCASAVQFEKAG